MRPGTPLKQKTEQKKTSEGGANQTAPVRYSRCTFVTTNTCVDLLSLVCGEDSSGRKQGGRKIKI